MATAAPTTTARTWGAPRALALAADGGSTWVEIVRSGTFYGAEGWGDPGDRMVRQVTISPADVDDLAASFSQVEAEGWYTGGMPVGCNHASLFGAMDADSTKALGRVLRVEARDNDAGGRSLWGEIRWTDEGAQRLRDGEFAAISAEIIPRNAATSKATGEPIGKPVLCGATLTNNPMIPGMAPPMAPPEQMAASERPAVLYLSETRPMPENAPKTLTLAESEVVTLREQAALVPVLRSEVKALTEERDALTKQRDELAAKETERMLDAACTVGRIAASERDRYRKVVATLGEAEAHAIFPVGRIKVSRAAEGAAAEGGPTPEPVDRIRARAAKLSEERGLNAVAAFDEAVREALADPTQREAVLKSGRNLTPTA